jgi:superfamily II DNA or RNA helicase
MAVVASLKDIMDTETGRSGMTAVLDSCSIILGKGRKKGGGIYTDVLDVYTEYAGGLVALPLHTATKLVPGLRLKSTTPIPPKNALRQPLPDQEDIVERMFTSLDETRGVMLDCDPGMGKTFMSWYVGIAYGLPIAVVVARVDYAKQWANELCEIFPSCASRICLMGGAGSEDDRFTCTPGDAHYLVIRAGLIESLTQEDAARYRYIVLDETHMLGTKVQLRAILRFTGAAYIVGCSGTPEKPDGRHAAIQAFLGPRTIVARRARPIDFVLCDINCYTDEDEYKVLLRSKPKGDSTVPPHMAEYGRMEISLASDPLTNTRIALVAYALAEIQGHKVLVLSKYKAQCAALAETLNSWGVSATEFTGDKKKYDGYAKVTIGTTQIAMTAFDQATSGVEYDRRFTAAVLCQSLAQDGNLWQGVGRIMRAPNTENPVFVWIQYPMDAYTAQTKDMRESMVTRGMRIKDHTALLPPEIYDKYLRSDNLVRINRTQPLVYPPHVIYPAPTL